jgi:oligopeptidase A
MSNPLLTFEYRIPFDQIRADQVEPAIDELIAQGQKGLDGIIAVSGERAYANTMDMLDNFSRQLEYAMHIAGHLEAVATTPELRQAYMAVQPKVAAFYSGIPLNAKLYEAIKSYATTDEAKSLTGARARYLKKTLEDFRRHGAELDETGKRRLEQIDIELSQITTKFSQNVLDATNAYDIVITDEAQLAGLPPSAVEAARESAVSKSIEGWRFTLHAPSYIAATTYLDDRDIRRDLYLAYNTRASEGEYDNRQLVLRILELRREKAALLGFKDFADLVLEDRMAHKGDRAQRFLDDLRAKTEARFGQENAELRRFAGLEDMRPWDVAYWAEKQRKALYDFDEEALRPYFQLDRVVDGMFQIFGRVLGIRVNEREGAPAWDPNVKYFDIEDESGAVVGGFYTDWFPRENKRGGAWMDVLITGTPSGDSERRHLGLICGNLTPPVGGKPSLLTHREVETIFHEFGHLLHHCLSRVEVRSLSGTNVAWDFVELPSQIMENWCWERESLDLFACHYETGEPIPEDLFQKMRRAKTFRAANGQMRQLGFGYVDMALHREFSRERDGDLLAYSRATLQTFAPAPLPENYAMIAGFTHLFASPVAYGAGYYSYKWAEVLDADAFTRFRNEGIFNATTGRAYRDSILARGDSADPAELYRLFMGRDPDPVALLERAGLLPGEHDDGDLEKAAE